MVRAGTGDVRRCYGVQRLRQAPRPQPTAQQIEPRRLAASCRVGWRLGTPARRHTCAACERMNGEASGVRAALHEASDSAAEAVSRTESRTATTTVVLRMWTRQTSAHLLLESPVPSHRPSHGDAHRAAHSALETARISAGRSADEVAPEGASCRLALTLSKAAVQTAGGTGGA